MVIRNTTSQNRSKRERLNASHFIPKQNVKTARVSTFLESLLPLLEKYPKEQILYSIGIEQLGGTVKNDNIRNFLKELNLKKIDIGSVPVEEFDLLGSAYQFLNTKYENLEKGSFYTGNDIVEDFLRDLDFSNGQTIFDPSCGSGMFLFSSTASANQIFGLDFDPIAVMIAKFNYYIKFPDAEPPNIYHADFFDWIKTHDTEKFDYIVGNPPYGATITTEQLPRSHIVSGESFSLFTEYSYQLLKQSGKLRFLLPEAFLNVKRHTDLRKYLLSDANMTTIKKYDKKFAGVMSDVYMLELDNSSSKTVNFIKDSSSVIPKSLYSELKNNVFLYLNKKDVDIIKKVEKRGKYDLKNSTFGLGVVTGDNKKKLFREKIENSEPIYTGKEITHKYTFDQPKNYIVFKREELQQVAPDEIYRAPEKLVYKTINKNLKVVIDTSKSLTTNSANIIIPKVDKLDIYVILALLNSYVYSFYHLKMFGGVNKIAKENLMALPLPDLTEDEQKNIEQKVRYAIKTNNDIELQKYINSIFNLTEDEVYYLRTEIAS